MRLKTIWLGMAALALAGGLHMAAAAQKKVTIAVSVPTADHGWTGGVLYYARQEAKALEAEHPGLTVLVKSSASPADQASALSDLTATEKIDALVVLRGIPTVIDTERVDGFKAAIKGSDIRILGMQFANWNRDDGFKVMQDFLAKYPHIDAVWAQDDDVATGVLQAIQQAHRSDINFVLGGAGMQAMIKKIMAGDKMVPADVLYPPGMIKTAMILTAAHFYADAPVLGVYSIATPLITKADAKDYYDPHSPF